MSTQDMKKLSTVLRSIEVIEEKTNAMHEEYTKTMNDRDNLPPMIINDQNVHLQVFFQHLEQLLQTDLKNRMSLLNNVANKKNYWTFFSQALKDSKGLYDTIVYVLNSQEVTTPNGRGRLFIRFCLQNHRLGDVMQHSFMTPKIVSQFYNDECFWSNPTYLNRIVQALYLLNELRFDLLSSSSYQLDVSWPMIETRPIPKNEIDQGLGTRTNSVSSLTSMNSVDSQAIVSVVSETTSPSFVVPNTIETVELSPARSMTSADEDPENTLQFWKEKYQQLEMNLKPVVNEKIDAQTQCVMIKETISQDKEENQQLKLQINRLQTEIQQLNDRLSSISATNRTIDNFEQERNNYQAKIKTQETHLRELQIQLDEQTERLKSMNQKTDQDDQDRQQRIELLQIELEKLVQLLDNERKSMEEERKTFQMTREQLEAAIQEKILDSEEMKRRLVKAVCEKAELFNAIHSYEVKLEEEQSRKWMADEEASACLKCNTAFGWTLRKHHCRHCQKIYCYYCSNNWIQNPKTNSPQYRVCDFCNEKLLKESFMPALRPSKDLFDGQDRSTESVDTRFEVRPEKLSNATTD